MSDFIRELETELLGAARRRAVRRRPRIAWRPIVALAVAAALLAGAFTALRPHAAERPAAPAGTFPLQIAAVPRSCDPGAGRSTGIGAPPAEVAGILAAVRQMPVPGDAIPRSMGNPAAWLPVGDFNPRLVRRIPGNHSKLRVVPTGDLRDEPCGTRSRGAGACLVYGADGERPRWGCFTVAEITAGRAFMLVDATRTGARLIGLVPDRRPLARVKLPGQYLLLSVWRNGTLRYLQGLRPQRVSVELLKTVWSVYVRDAGADPSATARVVNQLKRDFGVPSFLDRTPGGEPRDRSVVYFPSAALEDEARRVAARLGIEQVTRRPRDVKVAGPVDAPVLVLLGRMR